MVMILVSVEVWDIMVGVLYVSDLSVVSLNVLCGLGVNVILVDVSRLVMVC